MNERNWTKSQFILKNFFKTTSWSIDSVPQIIPRLTEQYHLEKLSNTKKRKKKDTKMILEINDKEQEC